MSETSIIFRKWEFTKDNQTYELGRPTLSVERDYATYMEGISSQVLDRSRQALGPIGYPEAMKIHLQNCVNNHYGWGRQGFLESLANPIHVARFLYCWFRKFYPDNTPLHIKKEDMYILYTSNHMEKLKTMVEECIQDPNPLAPE